VNNLFKHKSARSIWLAICLLAIASSIYANGDEFLPTQNSAINEARDRKLTLAQSYAELKSKNFIFKKKKAKTPEEIKAVLENAVNTFLTLQSKEPDWNSKNTKWKKEADLLLADGLDFYTHLDKDSTSPDPFPLYVNAIANAFTVDDLNALIAFYSSRDGANSETIVAGLNAEISDYNKRIMSSPAEALSGATTSPEDAKEISEIASLLSDRFSLVPLVASALHNKAKAPEMTNDFSVRFASMDFRNLKTIWETLSAPERMSILSWRNTTLGQREQRLMRQITVEVAGEIDLANTVRKLDSDGDELQRRWENLLNQQERPD